MEITEIDRQLFLSFCCSVLKSVDIFAISSTQGIVFVSIERLKKSVKGWWIKKVATFSNLLEILSIPEAFAASTVVSNLNTLDGFTF